MSFDDLDYRLPGGESLRQDQARGLAALADIASAGHRLPAVSTHGNLLSAMLCSIDQTFGFAAWQGLKNPDLFALTCEGGWLVVVPTGCAYRRRSHAAPP
jgi:2,3-bisphosphoglycerate-dependent phosphoglycerate mutase